MKELTIAYITSRKEPEIKWFFDSLSHQLVHPEIVVRIIIVDHYYPRVIQCEKVLLDLCSAKHLAPKPSIWKGLHRITSVDWWSKSNDLNTAVLLCQTEWIAFVDDRSVLCPGWLDCIYDAMNGGYAVVGTYEKHANMKVENGEIVDPGETLGVDHRPQVDHPMPTHDFYGGHCALPLEWCLSVNGWSEDVCDGLGLEDSMFGVTLRNSGFPMCYDARMKIIEDRTPGEIDGALKRADKGVSPRDKSHAIVDIFRDKTSSQNSFDIRNLRDRVLNGESLQSIMPSASHLDWFDGTEIKDMV